MKKLVIVCCFLIFHICPSIAQSRQQALHKWNWYPATEKSVFYRTGEWYGFPKPLQQKMYANMAKIIELIHQTPCMNPPKGFEVGVSATICEHGCTKGKIMSGNSDILFRAYFTHNNSTTIERHVEGPAMRVYFNDITRLLTRLPAGAEPYYEEREVTDSLRGFPLYAAGNLVVITKRKGPLFTPVTKEQLLQIEISDAAKRLEKTKADFRKANSEWEPLLRNMPVKDSLLKKELLKNIADQKPYIEKFENDLRTLKNKLASLSVSEKKEPAYNHYQEQRLVVPNNNFFDPSLPAHAIQLVVIDFNTNVLAEAGSYGNMFRMIKETLDLEKILAVLEE